MIEVLKRKERIRVWGFAVTVLFLALFFRWNLDQIVEKGGFQNKHELLAVVIENRLIVTTLEE